ncbi:hypothetical protein RJI07_05645 [Mycoplasmatota bacterium WC30]
MLFNIFTRTSAITDTISDFVGPYITKGMDLLTGLPVWLQAVALLVVGIFTIVGVVVFIKKFIKLFLVLAIIGGIVYVLYTQTDILDSILGTFSGSTTSILLFK